MFNIFNNSREASILFGDRYCWTMSSVYAKNNENDLVSFEMFVRSLPANRGYLVVNGVSDVIEILENLKLTLEQAVWLLEEGICNEELIATFFSPIQMETLKTVMNAPAFARNLLLKTVGKTVWAKAFNGEVWGIDDGTVIAPQTPILRVTASRIEGTLIESLLLSVINHQTMVASKVARIVMAANGAPVWDFSLRRLPGPESSLPVAKSAVLVGAAGSATLEASFRYGSDQIVTTGTMAHAFLMRRGPEQELEAMKEFLVANAHNAKLRTILIDTYNAENGIKLAIQASKETGISLSAIRLDSGDLLALAKYGRKTLDEADMTDTLILASDDLDEYKISQLVESGAPIDAYGVGTRLGTGCSPLDRKLDTSDLDSNGQPTYVGSTSSVGGVFKGVQQYENLDNRPEFLAKLAKSKQTDPGIHQVYRLDGPGSDLLAMSDEDCSGTPLLQKFMEGGKVVVNIPSLKESAAYCKEQLDSLPEETRKMENPTPLSLRRSDKLWALRKELGDTEAPALMEQEAHYVG